MIKSKNRFVNFGEVFTAPKEVNAMCDLVHDEIQRIDSKVLEPACGDGNFLAEILNRKLDMVEKQYHHDSYSFEYNALVAISCLYGIDIQKDNVEACIKRLFQLFVNKYTVLFGQVKLSLFENILYMLNKNIIHGDTLKMIDLTKNSDLLVSEFKFNEDFIQEHVFRFKDVLESNCDDLSLFSEAKQEIRPIKIYPAVDLHKVLE